MFKPETIIPSTSLSRQGYKVVAVIGWAGDFAAYQYYVNSSDEDCAARGDKISAEEARQLFPELKDYIYRR